MIAGLLAVALASASAATPARPAAGVPYWFKTYPTAPYKEYWTGELSVKDLPAALPKVLSAVEKSGGKLTQPLANFVSSKKDETQQLSFTLPLSAAKASVKALRKLGDMPDPSVRPAGAPIPVDEVKAKIALLMKEKSEHAAELAKVPSTAAAMEEILEHLLLVEELSGRVDSEVLFNLQVKRK